MAISGYRRQFIEESFNILKFSPIKNNMINQNKLTPDPSLRKERGGARRVTG
jgi:hypothetical protein